MTDSHPNGVLMMVAASGGLTIMSLSYLLNRTEMFLECSSFQAFSPKRRLIIRWVVFLHPKKAGDRL